MALKNYQHLRGLSNNYKPTNVVDLIKKVKIEEEKQKKRGIVIAAAAVSALAVTSFIIYL